MDNDIIAALDPDLPLPDEDKFESEIGHNFNGTLNEANLASVVRRMTQMFEGHKIAVATCHYCDHGIDNRFRLVTGREFEADWVGGGDEIIRHNYIGDKGRDGYVYQSASLRFSSAAYFWAFSAAPGNQHDHEDYRYSFLSFYDNRDGLGVEHTTKAPGGNTHKHIFAVQ